MRPPGKVSSPSELGHANRAPAGAGLQARAWRWALAHRAADGSLPSGSAIGAAHGRHERRGYLVKKAGQAGTFGSLGAHKEDDRRNAA